MLSANDHIEVGIGRLYGPPFLSRFLLYRLFDLNQAILICHRETSSVSASSHGKLTAMRATYVPPAVIYAHCCCESAIANVEELLRLPAVEIPAPANKAIIERLNDLAIRLEEYNLALTEKLIVAYEKEPRHTMPIEKSSYRVTGPINVAYWPDRIQSANIKRHCIKVSVSKWNTKTCYNIESVADWGLSAFDMEEVGQPPFEVNLERDTPIAATSGG